MRVLVKFRYSNPMVFSVPEERVSTLATMMDVEWVAAADGSQFYTAVTPDPVTVPVNKPVFVSKAVMDRVVELLRYGSPDLPMDEQHPSKIQAIKLVRQETNCTLVEAKDYVNSITTVINPHYPRVYDYMMEDDEYPNPPF